jgi:exodeoxyribonuclease-3
VATTRSRAKKQTPSLKIATFNINNVNRRLPNLLQWLKTSRPDVVCLQELKAAHEAFPAEALAKAGYHAVWKGQPTWNGVAILARGTAPVLVRDKLPGDPNDTQSRYIEAAVNGVLICCIYAPNGNPQPGPKFDYKLAWMKRLNRHAAKLFKTDASVILAGDYNVVPTDTDIYSTKSWKRDALLQPAPRQLFSALLKQGWTDVIRTFHPDAPMFTFWDYFRNHWERDAGLRIDHVLTNAKVTVQSCGVDRNVRGQPRPSDHAPVWVKIQRN